MLDLFTKLGPRHRAVPEVEDLVKQHGVMIFAQWIKGHVSYPCNKRAEALSKAATEHLQIDVDVKLIACQAKKIILARVFVSATLEKR